MTAETTRKMLNRLKKYPMKVSRNDIFSLKFAMDAIFRNGSLSDSMECNDEVWNLAAIIEESKNVNGLTEQYVISTIFERDHEFITEEKLIYYINRVNEVSRGQDIVAFF